VAQGGRARWLLAVALAAPMALPSAHSQPAARSLGATVLLANAGDHAADAALRESLSDPDPRVRIVAARAIGAVPHPELSKEIAGALAREQDPAVAGELARDLLYLGGAGAIEAALEHARRFGPDIAPPVAEWLGRIQPERLVALLPELTRLAGPRIDRMAAIVEMAQGTHPDREAAIASAWRGVAADPAWRSTLERYALMRRFPVVRGRAAAGAPPPPTAPGLRTMPVVAPGVIAETLASAGCKVTSSPRFGAGAIGFGADGRPRRIEVDPESMSNECRTAFIALARLAVADEDAPIGPGEQPLILPLVAAFVQCSSEPLPQLAPLTTDVRNVTPPRKVKDVRPQYPEHAQRQRIQGLIVMRSVIGESGCVINARVVRGVPELDWAAVAAVSQWAFEPSRIDGTPRAIVMTTTVSFSLR
jgi:protein TonB